MAKLQGKTALERISEKLNSIPGVERALIHEPMGGHTSFQVGGPADLFLQVSGEDGLIGAIQSLRREGVPYFVMGNGSNLVVRDGGYRGAFVCLDRAMGEIQIEDELLTAGAGALLSSVAGRAADAGLAGLAFAAGIPGSLGGALYMNAGAYDGEMAQVVCSARVYDAAADRVLTMAAEELGLGYRTSCFQSAERGPGDGKGRGSSAHSSGKIILSVTLKLRTGDREEIRARMRELNRRRNEKQPVEFPSAGSFFKRPTGYFAGKLIEDAGLKGLTVGGAQISEKHSGFIINTGGATAGHILALAAQVKEAVFSRFGVVLEPEPRIIGCDLEHEDLS